MSINNKNSLFSLIKGMGKTEKGYFKRFTLIHGKGESNYIKLFDAIAKQSSYDEAALRKKFKGRLFLKQFHVTKNYLYNLVLKSLVLYHQQNHVDVQVRDLLNRADLLFAKEMYKECGKMVDRAVTLAQRYELHFFMLEALKLKRDLAVKGFNFRELHAIDAEMSGILERVSNIRRFENLHDEIVPHYLEARNKRSRARVKRLASSPLLSSEKNAKNFVARKRFMECLIHSNVLLENKRKVYEYSRKNAMLYVNNPPMIQYETRNYLASLHNVIYGCIGLRKSAERKFWVEKLQESEAYIHTPSDKAFYLFLSYQILSYNNSIGDFEKSVHYCENVMGKKINAYKDKSNPRDLFEVYINIALSYFGTGHYHASLDWLNRIKNEIKLDIDPDAVCFFHMMYLLVHFELRHFDLMPYLVRSTYRVLVKTENLNPFRREWISFLKQVLEKDFSQKKLKSYFEEFRQRLKSRHQRMLESLTLELFDYISWLESKIEDRSFAEIVREKAG